MGADPGRLTIRNVGQADQGAPQHGMTMVYREVDGVADHGGRLADMGPTRTGCHHGRFGVTGQTGPSSSQQAHARYKLAVPAGNDANAAMRPMTGPNGFEPTPEQHAPRYSSIPNTLASSLKQAPPVVDIIYIVESNTNALNTSFIGM
jgi:hypothetical protein